MIDQLESELSELEARVVPSIAALDAQMRGVAQELAGAVRPWVRTEIQRVVESNAQVVNKGGAGFVAGVRAEVAAYLDGLGATCVQALGEQDSWPHITQSAHPTSESLHNFSRADERFFSEAFRKSLTPLGRILKRHGLIAEYTGWELASGRWTISLPYQIKSYPQAIQYVQGRFDFRQLQHSIAKKAAEIASAKAVKLWGDPL